MTDIVSPGKRTQMMRNIRSRDTQPEKTVRRWLHSHRIGYRLHYPDLPGHPDVVVPRQRIAIFVHGCFWHRHSGCKLAYMPKTNVEKWQGKFRENTERDSRIQSALQDLGWQVVTVWECSVRDGTYAQYLAEVFRDRLSATH